MKKEEILAKARKKIKEWKITQEELQEVYFNNFIKWKKKI